MRYANTEKLHRPGPFKAESRRRGRPRSLTPADEATVLDLILVQGLSNARAAKAVGVHSKTVGRFLRDRGDPRTEKLDAAAVADEYTAGGETYARLADRHNTSVSTIARAVQACGRPAKRGRPGENDGRRGRGLRRGWQGEDYPCDSLGQRGRDAWAPWLATMSDEQRASVEAALRGLNTPRHDALHPSRAAATVHIDSVADRLAAPEPEAPAARDAGDSDAGIPESAV